MQRSESQYAFWDKVQMLKLKFQNLRKEYPKFIYENFSHKIQGNDFQIVFSFRIPPDIEFSPQIIIKNINKKILAKIGKNALCNLVFHLGLIEMPSYWKTTCSPEIEIKAGYLDKKQTKWWKELFISGMGQFYYENKIDWRKKDFLKINNINNNAVAELAIFKRKMKNRYLIPFAGGRDSIVTLEALKKSIGRDWKQKISLFTVNPIEKIQKTAKVSEAKKQIIVRRIIDKKLLKLNRNGFLNGHTPFTSLLSFLAVLCAVLFNYKNIAFSNEKSANEGNVKYLGKTINHQWAKSSEFEKMFREYSRKYLAKDINYFSYIRKYGELQISKMLTKYPQYFPVFSSCNAGMKIAAETMKSPASAKGFGEARWCGNCVKCLFVYMTLYPFLPEPDLKIIFGEDIFQNKKLLPVLKDLVGDSTTKPWECVGTKKEANEALKMCVSKIKKTGEKFPYLLTKL